MRRYGTSDNSTQGSQYDAVLRIRLMEWGGEVLTIFKSHTDIGVLQLEMQWQYGGDNH